MKTASGLYKFTGEFSTGTEYKSKQSAVANKILVFTDTGVKSEQSVVNVFYGQSTISKQD